MIAEQRISGSIDQIDQIIRFDIKAQPWDEHINVVCNKVCFLENYDRNANVYLPVMR